jgi:Tol biopolymer transport system component/DNA-binding winged helix-turn-helix (wHTH) protein
MKGDFHLGPWLVQPSLDRLSLEGRIVQVRPKVMDLLVYLAGSAGNVISKETLLNEVWGTEAISESALTRTITELRSAVRDDVDQPRFLETIPKRGYRLIAPVRPVASQEESQARNRRVPALVILVGALLISGSLALLLYEMVPSEPTDAPRVRPLTAWAGHEVRLSFSPDGKRVALEWSGESDDNFDIYVKGIDDDSRVRLTTDPAPDRSPAWSPDGRAIAFLRGSNRGVAVYVIPASGGPEQFIATLKTRSLASPFSQMLDWAGDRALVVADQNSPEEPFHIIRLTIDTAERRQLTSPPPHSRGDLHPVVSPDGKTLAFTRGLAPSSRDIYVLPVTGGEPRRVTFDESVITALTWSEDGGSIVFSSERGAMAGAGSLWRVRVDASTARPEPEQLRGIGQRATGPVIARRGRRLAYVEAFSDTNVWRVAATGEGPAQPLVSSTREEGSPDYSEDGARIAFASNRSGNWEVWVASSDGSNQRPVTSYGAAPAWQPRWSPSGRVLAFSHTREGNADIYTISPEGSASRQLTSDPASDATPSWSGNGRWVYFSSNRSGAYEIWKTAVDEPARLLQVTHGGGSNPRESTDGHRLFYTKRTDSALEIWSTGVNGGAETRLLGPIYSGAGWVPDHHGIYFIEPARRIAHYRFATGDITPIAALAKEPRVSNAGLALSPDGRWLLYAQMDRSGADIMLVENFR